MCLFGEEEGGVEPRRPFADGRSRWVVLEKTVSDDG